MAKNSHIHKISKQKDMRMSNIRKSVESGHIKVETLFEYFYGEIAKAPTWALDSFIKDYCKEQEN